MSKSNYLTLDPTHRSMLKELEQRWRLQRRKLGIRHIIRAESGAVERHGFNLPGVNLPYERLANFHPNAPRMSAWVEHHEGCAELTATYGHPGWIHTPYDLSSIFPVNRMATELMYHPATRSKGDLPQDLIFHGDAELITDSRMYWFFFNWKAAAEDIVSLHETLTTPRSLLYQEDQPLILFHEQPHPSDIAAMHMRWM